MRQSIAAMMFCGLLTGIGCQSSASFKDKPGATEGLIVLKVNGKQDDVKELAEKQYGKDVMIKDVTDQMQTPGKPSTGERFFACMKANRTPAGLPPAPGGQIQQTGASTGRLPQPVLPGMIGSGYPGAGTGQPIAPQQPAYVQPNTGMIGRGGSGFGSDR